MPGLSRFATRNKAIRRGDLPSIGNLRAKTEALIDDFNETLAKPYRWTYEGQPLTAELEMVQAPSRCTSKVDPISRTRP